MKKIAIVVLAAATVLFTGASAGAAEMFTPPVLVGGGQFVHCHIVNVSAQTRHFDFQIIEASGAVHASGENTLGPGQSVEGQKANFRAAIKRSATAVGGDLIAIPAD